MLRPLQHVLHCTIAMHWAAAEDMLDLLLQYDLHTGIFPAAKGRQQLHLHWDYPANQDHACPAPAARSALSCAAPICSAPT